MGNIVAWIFALVGLFLLGLAYSVIIPVGNTLIHTFALQGAPVAQMLWVKNCTVWGFSLAGVFCIAYAFMYSYKETYDTGLIRG